MNNTSVGQSQRTKGKHFLLNSLIGQECGVMISSERYGRSYPFRPYFVIDLCAGDGRSSFESDTSSPAVIQKHMAYLTRNRVPIIEPVFCEKNKAAFDHLKKQIKIGTAVNADARSIEFLDFINERISGRSDFTTFIHNDPNLVMDWAITEALLNLLNVSAFTTYSTLGCNVGGVKRLPFENRLKWRLNVESLLKTVPAHHCAILVSLEGDAAQWAYLVTVPNRWLEKTFKVTQKAFRKTPFEVIVNVARRQGASDLDFYRQLDILTLTKKEMEGNDEEAV